MNKINWDEVQEASEFDNPKPGAYIATICRVEDVEEKEYLLIEWDFAEGTYKGNNNDTFARAGFWPIQLRRSYKPSALGFFKSFKTALEDSNPGYRFDEFNLRDMVHKPRFMLVKNVSEDWWTCCDFDGFKTFCAADYGERYLLYRRPPEVSP